MIFNCNYYLCSLCIITLLRTTVILTGMALPFHPWAREGARAAPGARDARRPRLRAPIGGARGARWRSVWPRPWPAPHSLSPAPSLSSPAGGGCCSAAAAAASRVAASGRPAGRPPAGRSARGHGAGGAGRGGERRGGGRDLRGGLGGREQCGSR